MNYTRPLNVFFARLDEDKRMSSYHISLYFALFQQWNADRFGEQFVIGRTETMNLSRLGSVNTYARCMKELSEWGYIRYNPSSNIHAGSRVSCIRFDTASDTAEIPVLKMIAQVIQELIPEGIQVLPAISKMILQVIQQGIQQLIPVIPAISEHTLTHCTKLKTKELVLF